MGETEHITEVLGPEDVVIAWSPLYRRGRGAGTPDRGDPQPDEEEHHEALGEGKWRLRLCRRKEEEHRNPLEQLRDQDEDIQVGGEDDADGVGRTPRASPVFDVVRN